MSWFTRGDLGNIPKESHKTDFAPLNFSLKYEETAKVIFVSGANACVAKVHELWGLEKGPVRIRCYLPMGQDCPFCQLAAERQDKGLRVHTFYLFTVLDLREYQKEDGSIVKFSRKLMLAKESTVRAHLAPVYSLIKDEYEKELEGAMLRISRGPKGNPSPASVGSSFHYLKHEDLSKYGNPSEFSEEEIENLFVTDEEKIEQYLEALRQNTSAGVDLDDAPF